MKSITSGILSTVLKSKKAKLSIVIPLMLTLLAVAVVPYHSAFATYECGTYSSEEYGADCTTTSTSTTTGVPSATSTDASSATSSAASGTAATPSSVATSDNSDDSDGESLSSSGATTSTSPTTKKAAINLLPVILFGASICIIVGVLIIVLVRKRIRDEKARQAQAISHNTYF